MTIRNIEPTPIVTVGPSSGGFGKHDVTAGEYDFGGMPFIYEHPHPWSSLAKYLEPAFRELTQKLIVPLLENQKTLEDFIDSALLKINGGSIYGNLNIDGNVEFGGKVVVIPDSLWHTDGVTEYPQSLVPVGTILPFAGANEPSGWVLCDGSEYKISDYPYLYTVCGTQYNTPAPTSGFFRVPNLKGRVIVGRDASDSDFNVVGETGGVKSVTLTAAQSGLPSHSHDYTQTPVPNGVAAGSDYYAATATSTAATTTTGPTDASEAHTNLQPYQVLNYVIKY